LDGIASKDLAPNLYTIARFKKRIVHTELSNNNWIRNLQGILSTTQMEEFTMLFMALANITLNDQNDQIFWKWISNGKFSVSSAYNA
jgi:DNA repair protein RadC